MTKFKSNVVSNTSPKNALKSGIYSNRLLEGEDPQLLQETIDGLVGDFEVSTSIGYQLAQELAQVMLKMSRSERWQCDLIASHMSKHKTRYEFASQLDLDVTDVSSLPDWYFNGSQKERESARKIDSAFIELDHLIRNHSAELMMKVKTVYPNLWWYVFGTNQAIQQRYTFAEILSNYSSKTDPKLRLKDLKEHIRLQESHQILWATSEERYEAVLCGLRAQVQMELAGDPNLQRGETQLHRRKSDLIAQLMQLSREQKTFSLSARQADQSHAQVITYKSSPNASDEAGAENDSVNASDSSTSDAQKASPRE
jgi:hypothetical protein